ncbi:unnamed protein product [Meganyctiphanes norvegica]|uniref:Caspase n=1 Tax=Meganyctiphanes norvegica TaxID=48144 RepID=A0AAV2SGQ7_MEGNR
MESQVEFPTENKDGRETHIDQNENLADNIDALSLGRTRRKEDSERLVANMTTSASCKQYNMCHAKRGQAVIFTHRDYSPGGPTPRPCATHDTEICKIAFEALGFEVEVYLNRDMYNFNATLSRIASRDHTNCDALVVVFMSHGCEEKNKEYLWLYDRKIENAELWKAFTADNCPTLAGKPKLFFIQACRGDKVDKGVILKQKKGLPVMTDAKVEEDYTIPLHADMLIMWASYPGMFAFKSGRKGMNGSVFLHYLNKVLMRDHENDDLSTMLLTVTREVATHFESVSDKEILHKNKQIPYTVSTLMRKIVFN